MNNFTETQTLSKAISKRCPDETIADLLNALLICEEDAELTDSEVGAGKRFFDMLTELRPDCVELAQQGNAKSSENAKMKNSSATAAYAKNFGTALDTLKSIERKLLDGPDCRSANWTSVGDLIHVNELLSQIATFIGASPQQS